MSKELEYEVNNFANLLHKDCMNLMECLKKQSEDNKPILYLGKHYQKVILPYEEYQKMCNRLEAIDNAEPSEALKCFENMQYRIASNISTIEYTTIKQALLKAQKEHKALEIIKEKECDMRWLKFCIKGNAEVETYNNGLPEYYEKLPEEEFNLLKEVLE